MSRTTWWPVAALGIGGLLWAAHGLTTALEASDERVRSGSGAAALLLTSLGLLALRRRLRSRRPYLTASGTVSTRIAIAFGLVSVVGVAALLDPVFTAALVLGALFLGIACLCLAAGVRRDTPPGRWPAWLATVGALAFVLVLIPAVQVLPEWGRAVHLGVFALAWLLGACVVPAVSR